MLRNLGKQYIIVGFPKNIYIRSHVTNLSKR